MVDEMFLKGESAQLIVATCMSTTTRTAAVMNVVDRSNYRNKTRSRLVKACDLEPLFDPCALYKLHYAVFWGIPAHPSIFGCLQNA